MQGAILLLKGACVVRRSFQVLAPLDLPSDEMTAKQSLNTERAALNVVVPSYASSLRFFVLLPRAMPSQVSLYEKGGRVLRNPISHRHRHVHLPLLRPLRSRLPA